MGKWRIFCVKIFRKLSDFWDLVGFLPEIFGFLSEKFRMFSWNFMDLFFELWFRWLFLNYDHNLDLNYDHNPDHHSDDDLGKYSCKAKNSLGSTDGEITLYGENIFLHFSSFFIFFLNCWFSFWTPALML